MSSFDITSKLTLKSGYEMPILGFGVSLNMPDTIVAC